MTKLWQLFLASCVAWAIPTMVKAQNLGLNFAATDPDAATSSLNPTDVAGVVPQANWNNLELNTGTDVGSLEYDNNGTPVASTATVSWTSNNTWRSTDTGNNAFPAGPDRVLMAGYLDTLDTTAGAISLTVNNIDAVLRTPAYDVYVYMLGDSGENRGGGYTLDDGSGPIVKYGSTMAGPTAHVEDPGTDIDNSLDGTYLRFTSLTGSSFTLTADTTLTTPNGFRSPINGLQIVPVTPGDVNGDGLVNITDFHIIRSNLFKTGQSEAQGDLVGTGGVVDFADYREWKTHAGAGFASVALFGSVPEPSSALLFTLGAAIAAIAGRRAERRYSRWAR